jgi:hypothetical protein
MEEILDTLAGIGVIFLSVQLVLVLFIGWICYSVGYYKGFSNGYLKDKD